MHIPDRLFTACVLSVLRAKQTHPTAHVLPSVTWWLSHPVSAAAYHLPPGLANHRDTYLYKQVDLYLESPSVADRWEVGQADVSRIQRLNQPAWKMHQDRCTERSRAGNGRPHWVSSPCLGFFRQEY